MPHEQLSIRMDSEVIAKLRKYFPGRIGELLERKAKEAIAEMEETPKSINKEFEFRKENGMTEFAPGRWMDDKQFKLLLQTIPDDQVITSKLIVSVVDHDMKKQRAIPSRKGTLPGTVVDLDKEQD